MTNIQRLSEFAYRLFLNCLLYFCKNYYKVVDGYFILNRSKCLRVSHCFYFTLNLFLQTWDKAALFVLEGHVRSRVSFSYVGI